MRKKSKVVQINNTYIQNQHVVMAASQQRHRLLGLVLVLMIFLLILPTYNLVASYKDLQLKRQELSELKKEYKNLEKEVKDEQLLVKRLSDETYAAKYVRAKYYYSTDGEIIFTIPRLTP